MFKEFLISRQNIVNKERVTPGAVATTLYGKTNRSSPTNWKMFLKSPMICRASISLRMKRNTRESAGNPQRRARHRGKTGHRTCLQSSPTLKMAACQQTRREASEFSSPSSRGSEGLRSPSLSNSLTPQRFTLNLAKYGALAALWW